MATPTPQTEARPPAEPAHPSHPGGPGPPARDRRRPSWFYVLGAVVAAAFTFLAVYPVARVLLRLFMTEGRIDLSPFREVAAVVDLGSLLFDTLSVVAVSAVLALVVGFAMAWIAQRTDAGLGRLTDILPLIPFLVPPVASAIGWMLLLSDRAGFVNVLLRRVLGAFGVELTTGPFNVFTWWGLTFVYFLYMVPFVYLLVSAGLRNLDPSLEEQSYLSGASTFRTIRSVTLPAIAPSIGASFMLLLWFGTALFAVPVIIGTPAGLDILTVRIVRLLRYEFPAQMGAAVVLGAIIVLIVGSAWYLQRRILLRGRHAKVSGKGHRVTRVRLGRWVWPARAMFMTYILLATILPTAALAVVALTGFWTSDISLGDMNLDSFRDVVLENRVMRRSLTNSLTLGAIGATVGMAVAAILSVFLWSNRSRGGWVALVDGAIKMPAAVSNIVIAVGFILAFSAGPFFLHGTLLILLLSYLVVHFPQGSVAADAALSAVGQELIDAAHVSGSSEGRTFLRITAPLMLSGLVAGWAFVFIRMVGDLTASALLAGIRNPVVGFTLLEIYEHGRYADLATLALVLTAVTAAILAIVMGIVGKSALLRRESDV